MLSSTSVRVLRAAIPSSRCLLQATSTRFASSALGKDPQVSQGTSSRSDVNRSPQDVRSQAVASGYRAKNDHSDDAATGSVKGASRSGPGNPEGVGMKEQVGGASASDRGTSAGAKGREEAASAPGYIGKAKQALGIEKDRDVKRDDRRAYHSSAVARAASAQRADPDAARAPHDRTAGEQNAHLRHKKGDKPDAGKGNAGAEPALPSQKTPQVRSNAPERPPKPSSRAFHTSARAAAPIGNPSADPEQQPLSRDDEDMSASEQSKATQDQQTVREREREIEKGKQQLREQNGKRGTIGGHAAGTRGIHTSSTARAEAQTGKASADSYFKDVDEGPSSQPGVHKVDSSSDALGETGPYHQAGVGDKEYETVDKKAPYDEPSDGHSDEKLRYGNVDKRNKDKGGETSGPKDSPAEGNKGGRKPE